MKTFQLINDDLNEVQKLIKKNFKIKAGHLNDFVSMDFNYIDQNLRPAMVILSNRLFKPSNEKAIGLAGVLQFIYMASKVHLKVKESTLSKEKQADSKLKFQYPVLVGDYLYGKFFTTLCETGIVCYLKNLAELICSINNGGILDQKYTGMELTEFQQNIDVIKQETAELFACAASLGADAAGACAEHKQQLYNFGLNFGIAYGLLERGSSVKQVHYFLHAAEDAIKNLPPSLELNLLKDLLLLLVKENNIFACNMVV